MVTTALDDVYREIEIMKQLNHSNLMGLVEVVDDPSSDDLFLVMPLADYGDSLIYESQNSRFKPNHKL